MPTLSSPPIEPPSGGLPAPNRRRSPAAPSIVSPAIPWTWLRIAFAVVLAFAVNEIYRVLNPYIGDRSSLIVLAYLAVIASAWAGRFLSGLLTLLLCTGLLIYYSSEPPQSFRLASMQDLRLIFLFFGAGLLICYFIEALYTGKRVGEQLAAERRGLAASLLTERQRLAALLSNLPGIVWEVQRDPGSGRLGVSFVSANSARLLGRAADELQATSMAALSEGTGEELRQAVAEVVAGGPARSLRHRWRHAGGEELWFETHVAPEGGGAGGRAICVSVDVSESENRERMLVRSEERFREAADRAPIMIWIAEKENGFVWANRTWLDFRGRELAGERGLGWVEGVHPTDAANLSSDALAAFERGEEFRLGFRVRRADGAWRWLLSIGVPRFGPDGRVHDFLVFSIDMSERKQIEMERESLLEGSERARIAAEMATRSKDDFLAKVSHELRNPLNGILGWTQILRRGDASEEDTARGIELIDLGARSLVQLVDDLLDVSRITAGKMQLTLSATDLKRTITAACQSVTPSAAAKGVTLDCVLDSGVGTVMGDARRLQQVAWNLLANAVKFTPRGGRVEVRLWEDNGYAVVAVTDSGIGIDPEFLPHVFSPFTQQEHTSTRRYRGLGLGLSIVRHLTELHGGTVGATSPGLNRGSTFEVRLPIATGKPAGESDPGDETNPPAWTSVPSLRPLEGVRVLVVDDDATARELVPRLLEGSGATLQVAGSAEEGLAALMAQRPDVLVSDIEMPGTDGLAFLRRVRQLADDQGGATPAVALTAYVREEDRKRALLAGFQAHLGKPVNAEELVETLRRFGAPGAGEGVERH